MNSMYELPRSGPSNDGFTLTNLLEQCLCPKCTTWFACAVNMSVIRCPIIMGELTYGKQKQSSSSYHFKAEFPWLVSAHTPPGTSDEHLTVVKTLLNSRPEGAILVTTPQDVAMATIRKEIKFCHKMNLNIIGIVENMSTFVCPCCQVRVTATERPGAIAPNYLISYTTES